MTLVLNNQMLSMVFNANNAFITIYLRIIKANQKCIWIIHYKLHLRTNYYLYLNNN